MVSQRLPSLAANLRQEGYWVRNSNISNDEHSTHRETPFVGWILIFSCHLKTRKQEGIHYLSIRKCLSTSHDLLGSLAWTFIGQCEGRVARLQKGRWKAFRFCQLFWRSSNCGCGRFLRDAIARFVTIRNSNRQRDNSFPDSTTAWNLQLQPIRLNRLPGTLIDL